MLIVVCILENDGDFLLAWTEFIVNRGETYVSFWGLYKPQAYSRPNGTFV